MHVRHLDGSAVADVPVTPQVAGEPPEANRMLSSLGQLAVVADSGPAAAKDGQTSTRSTTEAVDVTDGHIAWTAPNLNPEGPPTNGSFTAESDAGWTLRLASSGTLLYQADKYTELRAYADDLSDCGWRAVVSLAAGQHLIIADAADGSVGHHVASNGGDLTSGFFVLGSTLISTDGGGVAGFGASGQKLWSLPDAVVKSVASYGRWLVVTNPSDQKVLVDPATGTDVTAAHRDVATDIFAAATTQPAFSDPAAGIAIIESSDAPAGQTPPSYRVAHQVPYADV